MHCNVKFVGRKLLAVLKWGWKLKRCVHKLRKSQKMDYSKTAVDAVDMQTSEIQLHSGVDEYISYGSALFYKNNK